MARFSTEEKTRTETKSVRDLKFKLLSFKIDVELVVDCRLLSVMFQIQKSKKDSSNAFKSKQFIAWWIDKAFLRSPDNRIVALFDMTNCGLSTVVRIHYSPSLVAVPSFRFRNTRHLYMDACN